MAANSKKTKRPSASEMTPAELEALDNKTLVGMLMRVLDQNRELSEILRMMVNEKHAPKTERFENPEQLRLFKEQEVAGAQNTSTVNDKSADSPSHQTTAKGRKKPGHTRNPMPACLDRKKITGELPADLTCRYCDAKLELVREILKNSRLECIPITVFVEDFVTTVFECTGCGETVTIEPPEQLTENGTAGPALMTDVCVARFADHMPWYRQEQRFARMGVAIARSTMVGWMKWMTGTLRPLYDRMHELLLLSKVIATDDTPVKVQDRSLRKKLARKLQIKTGRMWIYRGDDANPFNIFHYTEGRARAGPLTFLKGYDGFLQGDCFSGNLALCAETGCTFVACLVHARRYFIKAQLNNKSACQEILQMFSEIFETERMAQELELNADQIKLMREQESKPVLEKMKKWLDEQVLIALPKSAFGKGVNYCLNNWTELNNYLLDGDLTPHNNLAEQEMKKIAIGKKNWYFLGSDEGGKTAEVLLSLISTCQRHDVNPSEYLKDVIQTLSKNPAANLDPLLPHNWKQNREKSEINSCQITPKVTFA
ncbi:MAG: IS66 family transposase [Candidatus Obscuribacterales bacterium]|nr:IS66 family transposase [Candidatus Obscuribacterales bacterium]